MRQLILLLFSLIIFVASFGAAYISLKTAAPHVRGMVGGGLFFLTSFLLLWNDLASVTTRKVF
jgi:hypothetical protein